MRSLFALLAIATVATAFSPAASRVAVSTHQQRTGPLALGIDPEREGITRENEPDEFFSTNTDKMSDEQKLPIALAGIAGISLPFILGLIALYAAK